MLSELDAGEPRAGLRRIADARDRQQAALVAAVRVTVDEAALHVRPEVAGASVESWRSCSAAPSCATAAERPGPVAKMA